MLFRSAAAVEEGNDLVEGRAGEVAVEDRGADDRGNVEEDELCGYDNLRAGKYSECGQGSGRECTLLSKRISARLR